ncbi:unnamed protein product [Amoebophrya sp. A120]|nr:unnamed protein product [Amoebophrya sp. A120]|eukprot:GSA120T00004558001.1
MYESQPQLYILYGATYHRRHTFCAPRPVLWHRKNNFCCRAEINGPRVFIVPVHVDESKNEKLQTSSEDVVEKRIWQRRSPPKRNSNASFAVLAYLLKDTSRFCAQR